MVLLLAGIASLPAILVYILIIGIFLATLYFIINRFFPEPMRGYAVGVVVVVAAILLIYLLLQFVGGGASLP
jgi:hypothetical protein